MNGNVIILIFCFCWGLCLGQFSNIFSSVMNSAPGGTSKSGSNCTAITSCYPWCARQMDKNGCVKCQCSNSGSSMSGSAMSGVNPMYGMNPMAAQSGLNPMAAHSGLNPMAAQSGLNPMAHMFSGLSGGMSPMTGGHMQLQAPGCGPVPTTCPVPQPWCERIVGKDGCVKCICGKDLLTYLGSLKQLPSGQSTVAPSSSTPLVTTRVSKATTTSATTRATLTTGSCITNFYCTKLCDNGYETDPLGCPVCECIKNGLIDTPVDATDPPGKKHAHPVVSTYAPTSATGQVISCPGIFNCALLCQNGYKTNSNGCPLCECMH